MCFHVRSIKCLDCRFSVWLFLQLCGRAWCVLPGAGLGESSSMLRQKQVVFMGMSNRNMALERLSVLILVTEWRSPRCVKGFCFRTWCLYTGTLSCQTRQKLSFHFSCCLFVCFNLEKVETNVSNLKFISFQTLIEEHVHCSGQKS